MAAKINLNNWVVKLWYPESREMSTQSCVA